MNVSVVYWLWTRSKQADVCNLTGRAVTLMDVFWSWKYSYKEIYSLFSHLERKIRLSTRSTPSDYILSVKHHWKLLTASILFSPITWCRQKFQACVASIQFLFFLFFKATRRRMWLLLLVVHTAGKDLIEEGRKKKVSFHFLSTGTWIKIENLLKLI